jgi:hypothetical protein
MKERKVNGSGWRCNVLMLSVFCLDWFVWVGYCGTRYCVVAKFQVCHEVPRVS